LRCNRLDGADRTDPKPPTGLVHGDDSRLVPLIHQQVTHRIVPPGFPYSGYDSGVAVVGPDVGASPSTLPHVRDSV
jgi:hypothetical protein